MQTSGDQRREKAKLYPAVIASEAKQSIAPQRKNGLLRFARNDDLETAVMETIGRGVLDAPLSRSMTVFVGQQSGVLPPTLVELRRTSPPRSQ